MPQMPMYLKPEQQAMLRALAELGGQEKTSKQVAEQAGVDLRAAGARLAALEHRWLVTRTFTSNSGGVYIWSITEQGRQQAGDIEHVSDAMVTKAMDAFFDAARTAQGVPLVVAETNNPREAMRAALEAVIA